MIRLFVRHKVSDFAAWKQGYDAFDATRRTLGVKDAAIFRGAEDPGEVTVWHDFESLAAAKSFMKSPELAAAMKRAGLAGEPQVWFADRELPR